MANSKFDQELADTGKEGEDAFKSWLDGIGISYVAVCQSPDTFAKLFKNTTKRPDFLVLFESIGIIAVDVKKYTQGDERYWTLPYEKELKRVLTFERLFRLPVWYAYYIDGKKWHWISALKAVEVGKLVKNKDGEVFVSIKVEEFIEVSTNNDLGKLFEARLPALTNIAKVEQ